MITNRRKKWGITIFICIVFLTACRGTDHYTYYREPDAEIVKRNTEYGVGGKAVYYDHEIYFLQISMP